MRLRIKHRTEYGYDSPVPYALQRIRLVPMTGELQTVFAWSLTIHGAQEQVRYLDHFGNDTRLSSAKGGQETIAVEVEGEVETLDRAGMSGAHRGFAPLWLFQSATTLTSPGEGVRAIVDAVPPGGELDRLHALMAIVRERVDYTPGATTIATTAEEAVGLGAGVCQDHTHIMLAAARLLGFPSRYVSGYLMVEGEAKEMATHAWAEMHVNQLGWVGFDASNVVCPDGHYVRLATGRDYRDAMPLSGIRLGQAGERLEVNVVVEQ